LAGDVRRRRDPDPTRLARLEILGAWLHVWTPPRGVVVPPVPWRWVAVAAAALAAVVAAVLLVVAPRVDEAKRRGAAEEARLTAQARREQAAALRRDQRVTFVALEPGPVVPQIVAAVGAGVRARVRAGEFGARPIRAVECGGAERYSRGRTAYACLAVRSVSRTKPPVKLGVPVVAVVAPGRRRLAWCKVNEIAGEGASYAQVRVPLPRPCAR
jgi:hypothetical protein